MKKLLVLTLVLVFALSASAFAGVSISGEFTAKLEQEFELFDDVEDIELRGFGVSTSLDLTVSGSGAGTAWDLSAELGDLQDGDVSLGKYTLTLTDDYFTAWVWGNEQEIATKADYFSFIEADGEADDHRVRLEVPVVDVATVTLDLDPGANLYTFVDGEINGHAVGLAVNSDISGDKFENQVVGYGTVVIDPVTLKLAAGLDLEADDDKYAYGLDAAVAVSEAVELTGKFVGQQENFGDSKELAAGLNFEEGLLQASAGFGKEGSYAEFDTTTLDASLAYRLNEADEFGAAYNELVAPMFSLSVKQVKEDNVYGDFSYDPESTDSILEQFDALTSAIENDNTVTTYTFGAEVSAPLLADVIWGKVGLNYTKDDAGVIEVAKHETFEYQEREAEWVEDNDQSESNYNTGEWNVTPEEAARYIHVFADSVLELNGELTIQATERLSLTPFAEYTKFKGGNAANYFTTIADDYEETDAADREEVDALVSEGTITTFGAKAAYKLGGGDTTLGFEYSQTGRDYAEFDFDNDDFTNADLDEKYVGFSVTVKF